MSQPATDNAVRDSRAEAPIRVLHVISRWYPQGGIENLLKTLVSTHPTDAVDHSIASVLTPIDDEVCCDTHGPLVDSGAMKDVFANAGRIVECMAGGYDVVHIHTNNGMGFYYAHLAEKAGVPKRIVHCHNAGVDAHHRALKTVLSRALSLRYKGAATDRWACAANAGEYLFGTDEFTVFLNGIDTARFAYAEEKRRAVRESLGVADGELLVGNIGRISEQKNPLFQLNVFGELRKRRDDVRYCMVGKGELSDERDALAESLGLGASLSCVESTDEPEAFYAAFDVLLFPCVFEALSFVGIEAQCSGLKVLASTAVPAELGITELIEFTDLSDGAEAWAERLSAMLDDLPSDRSSYSRKVAVAGYGVVECFERMERAYGSGGDGKPADAPADAPAR